MYKVHLYLCVAIFFSYFYVSYHRLTKRINKFFCSRTCHAYLDAVSFDSLRTVSSQLSKTLSNSAVPPKSTPSPLLHISVSMSPAAYAALQIIQFTSMPLMSVQGKEKPFGPFAQKRKNDKRNVPLLTVYAKGIQCSGLVHHDTTHVTSDAPEEATSKHTELKVSSVIDIPILQAALFAIIDSPEKKPLSSLDPRSLIWFNLSFPVCDSGRNLQAVQVLEVGLRDSALSLAAKVQQSELCSNTVLTWDDIHQHTPNTSPVQTQSERSDNTISVNIKLPYFCVQFSSPTKAIPSGEALLTDPSIVTEIAIAWKIPIANVTSAVKSVLRNKLIRDRKLLFSLLNSGLEMRCQAKVCEKVVSCVNLSDYFIHFRSMIIIHC